MFVPTSPAPATVVAPACARGLRSAAALVVGCSAVIAGAVAIYLRLQLFPEGSANNDEGVYLAQAHALTQGRLTLPLPADAQAHQPWLFAIRDGAYVSKYLPVAAACYAAGLALFSSVVPVLVAMAMAVPVLTYRLGGRLGMSAGRSAAAAALFGLSPAVLVQSGLALSYLPFLVLMLGCWIAVFRAADSVGAAAGGWAALAGGLGALGGCVRPMDGLLMLGPALLWLTLRHHHRRRVAPAVVAGAAPIAVLVMAYDRHVTGSAVRLPFSLLEPADSLGFGGRRFFPEDMLHHYGPAQAIAGTARHFLVEPAQWIFGFLAVLVLACWAARRGGSAGERHRLLLGCSALTLAGYVCFWGPYHASVIWGGTRTFGPLYSLAPIAPLVLAALTVPLGTRALVGLLALAGVHPVVHGTDALARAQRDNRTTTEILALAAAARPSLLEVDPPYLGHPVTGLGGGLVLASQLAPTRLPPGPWRELVLTGNPYRSGPGPAYQLREKRLTQGQSVLLRVRRAGFGPREVLVVSRGGITTACRQGPAAVLTLTAHGVTGCAGQVVPPQWVDRAYRACPDLTCLVITTFTPTRTGHLQPGAWRRLPVETVDGTLRLLTDGPALHTSGHGWISVTAG